jgi:hypothetical protein
MNYEQEDINNVIYILGEFEFFNDDISSIATNETSNYDDLMEPYEIQDEEIFDLSGTFSYLSADITTYV